MKDEFVLLTVKEEMWARMLMEVLQDNGILCTSVPVLGAGMVIKTGLQEKLAVYVPADRQYRAEELLEELFSEESIITDL